MAAISGEPQGDESEGVRSRFMIQENEDGTTTIEMWSKHAMNLVTAASAAVTVVMSII